MKRISAEVQFSGGAHAGFNPQKPCDQEDKKASLLWSYASASMGTLKGSTSGLKTEDQWPLRTFYF
jgi:hypothetical protein